MSHQDTQHRCARAGPFRVGRCAKLPRSGETSDPIDRSLIALMKSIELAHDLVAARLEHLLHAIEQTRTRLTQVEVGLEGKRNERRSHQQCRQLCAQRPVPESQRHSYRVSACVLPISTKAACKRIGMRTEPGAGYLTRTGDLPLTRRLLYQLS